MGERNKSHQRKKNNAGNTIMGFMTEESIRGLKKPKLKYTAVKRTIPRPKNDEDDDND